MIRMAHGSLFLGVNDYISLGSCGTQEGESDGQNDTTPLAVFDGELVAGREHLARASEDGS